MAKTRVDSQIDVDTYIKLVVYTEKNSIKNTSRAVNHILREHFLNLDAHKRAVENLNKVLRDRDLRILNLEHEIRSLRGVKDEKTVSSLQSTD